MRELRSPMQRYPPVIAMNKAVSQKHQDIYVYILGRHVTNISKDKCIHLYTWMFESSTQGLCNYVCMPIINRICINHKSSIMNQQSISVNHKPTKLYVHTYWRILLSLSSWCLYIGSPAAFPPYLKPKWRHNRLPCMYVYPNINEILNQNITKSIKCNKPSHQSNI